MEFEEPACLQIHFWEDMEEIRVKTADNGCLKSQRMSFWFV